MSFQFDLLIHVANVLYLFAFMVRDILWLRILTVIAASCLIPYFYFQPVPLMTPREMIKILKLATWEEAATGECFVERDKPLDRLMVIFSGKACVEVDGRNVTELEPGQFIGSISYVTEETAPANIVSLEPTRYVSWPKSKLKEFMNKNPDLHSALKTTLAVDLTKWLQATWARETS